MNDSADENPASANPSTPGPGLHQETLELSHGRSQRYTIDIPSGYDGTEPVPLIVALHYGGPVTPWYGAGVIEVLMKPALGELDAIIIAPDALEAGWNNDVNEAAVLELIAHTRKTYAIAGNDILLTGFSMGGAGTWYIGGRNQDLFRALIPIAGRPHKVSEWKVPVHIIHSKADDVVPFGPAVDYAEDMKAAGADVTVSLVDQIPHYQTAAFAKPLREALPWIRRVLSSR